jgi:ketosteroid isomerase-like protein
MKKMTILLGTMIFIAIACTPPVDKTDDEAEAKSISDVSMQVVESWNKGDYEGFMELIDDEAILLPQNAPSIVGIEAIKSLYSNSFENFTFIVKESIEEITVSGDYGYVLGNWVGSMNPVDGSDPINFNNKTLDIFKKQPDGSWLMYRVMYSSNEIPQEKVSPELTE